MTRLSELEEEIAQTIAEAQNVPFVGPKQKRVAAALMPLARKAQAEAWDLGVNAAQVSYECDYYDPWRRLGDNPFEQNSEGNVT